jgi:hypothetical protein
MARGVHELVKARLIGENRFLVEFGSEQTLKFVLNPGEIRRVLQAIGCANHKPSSVGVCDTSVGMLTK